ncbi:SMC family ATPase, partial [Clavibacter californiensis]
MELHRLTLQAIGPFAGEHVIDFAELGRSGLFLLEGPTGSGKSTLIDAVVFALYGSLASEGSSRDRLHSHHAAPGVEPYVELVFETAAGIHRVRRSPQHQRPKARGTGTTNQNASATLARLSSPDADAGEVIGTTTQEVGTEVARIVGLTRAQFVQTVVLPQGEFAEFLRSTGEQRRLVLQSLFGTAVYERTAAQLGEMRKAAKARTDAADAKVAEALTGLREATRVDALEIADARDTVRLLAELADAAEAARTEDEGARQDAATALA